MISHERTHVITTTAAFTTSATKLTISDAPVRSRGYSSTRRGFP